MLGLLTSAFFMSYAIMQIPVGLMADSVGPRKIISSLVLVFSAGAFLFGLSHDFWVAVAARAIMGLGASVVYVSSLKLISEWFTPDQRAGPIGVVNSAAAIGGATITVALPLLFSVIDWHLAYTGFSVLLLATAVLAFLVVRDSPEGLERSLKAPKGERARILSAMASILKNRNMWTLMLTLSFAGGTGFVYTTWIPKFLIDTRGMSLVEGGIVVSSLSLSSIPGNFLSGAVSDRIGKRKSVGLIGLCAHFLAVSVLVFLSGQFPLPLVIFTAIMVGMTFSMFWVAVYTMATEIYPASMAGAAAGTLNTFTFMSSIVYPIVTGGVIDLTGSYELAFAVPVAGEIVGALVFALFTTETFRRR